MRLLKKSKTQCLVVISLAAHTAGCATGARVGTIGNCLPGPMPGEINCAGLKEPKPWEKFFEEKYVCFQIDEWTEYMEGCR